MSKKSDNILKITGHEKKIIFALIFFVAKYYYSMDLLLVK